MSRVGKKTILFPANVEVNIDGQTVAVKGPKGELTTRLHPCVSIKQEETPQGRTLTFTVSEQEEKKEKSQWGTAQANVSSMIEGVLNGYSKQLEIEGVGYRVSLSGNKLVLGLGFSHDINFQLSKGIEATVDKNTITLKGVDKQLVGQMAAQIRKLRKPEPYKGKGIHYTGEHIRRKAGKTAKTAE